MAGLRTIRELQRGASGVIVLAEERGGAATPVAVKLMPRDKAASPALQREMLTQRSCLMHPHVIQVRREALDHCKWRRLRMWIAQQAGKAVCKGSGAHVAIQRAWDWPQLPEHCADADAHSRCRHTSALPVQLSGSMLSQLSLGACSSRRPS